MSKDIIKRVVVESPYGGTDEQVKQNIKYARSCVRDCLNRGEVPFASHLLYTQPGILNDNVPSERKLGIEAGFELTNDFDLVAIYTDLGLTHGMVKGLKARKELGKTIEERTLGKDWEEKYDQRIIKHSHKDLF